MDSAVAANDKANISTTLAVRFAPNPSKVNFGKEGFWEECAPEFTLLGGFLDASSLLVV